jgi:hypothetical protein
MSFSLTPFTFALSQASYLRDLVLGASELLERPAFVRAAVAARLRKGVRALEAFLRRILILMALDIEPDLVAETQTENLARAKERKVRAKKASLRIFPTPSEAHTFDFQQRFGAPRPSELPPHAAALPPVTVPIGRWLRQLDYLQTIIKDPVAKAKRLAFCLAQRHHGLLMAPDQNRRVMRGCGTEPNSIFDAMAFQILQKRPIKATTLTPATPMAKAHDHTFVTMPRSGDVAGSRSAGRLLPLALIFKQKRLSLTLFPATFAKP